MMNRIFINLLYISALTAVVILSIFYVDISNGLAVKSGEGRFYCRELVSSGRDDDFLTVFGVFFGIPLLIRTFRVTRATGLVDTMAISTTSFVFWAILLSIPDCGDVIYTMFVIGDLALVSILVLNIIAIVSLILLQPKDSKP